MAGNWRPFGPDGFSGYLATPSADGGPGLLLLHDQDGISSAIEALADTYAEEGYFVLVPDLFWRVQPRSSMAGGFGPAGDCTRHFDPVCGMHDLAVAIAFLGSRPGLTGKIGALGFGFGGRLAYRLAVLADLHAVVAYGPFGAEMPDDPDALPACPVVLHIGGEEGSLPTVGALVGRKDIRVFRYPNCGSRFYDPSSPDSDKAAALMAYSRTIDLLHATLGPQYDLAALWEEHTFQEFGARDAATTMKSMVAQPYVNHIPTMTGGVGHDELLRFYRHHFIPKTPADTKLVLISRTIGADRLVDEMLFCFTHDIEIDWMLPGVPPTGRYVEIPLVAIVRFRGDKLYNEHIYWDQASVLVQIGMLDPAGLPVAGVETARKLLDESRPSNTLMRRWAESAGQE